MKEKIEINKIGKIKQGNYLDWYVEVIDDTSGETGGFYINIFKNFDGKGEAYDNWLENFNDVEEYFIDANWIIEWDVAS
ncbi:hypothetical protein [Emticicia sp. C21]|uniref:hypothetical protein n=1 Tax=Emticicia sp. C21 TaxID=2302915 RepID=UPI000E35570D|nr:hypothetical protein [Emticicia sp. C21]RFS15548.1 hypothetical protein D0T08_15470 [Emticicia sp. C21]